MLPSNWRIPLSYIYIAQQVIIAGSQVSTVLLRHTTLQGRSTMSDKSIAQTLPQSRRWNP